MDENQREGGMPPHALLIQMGTAEACSYRVCC